jgi:predicted DNA-binding protein
MQQVQTDMKRLRVKDEMHRRVKSVAASTGKTLEQMTDELLSIGLKQVEQQAA